LAETCVVEAAVSLCALFRGAEVVSKIVMTCHGILSVSCHLTSQDLLLSHTLLNY